jgi:multidrug resistance efflux pump
MENTTQTQIPAPKQSMFKKPWVQSLAGIVAIILLLIGALLYKVVTTRVTIDLSMIEAPIINIGPQNEGILQSVYVNAGDVVTKGEPLAQVGGEVLSAQINGQVITVQNAPGQVFMPGATVVSMIDPTQLRVVGTIDENKGLSRIKIGDSVAFTVDAFGSSVYTGVVDEISPTSDTTGVAFSISDQRPTKQFDIKVAYDIASHPEFKNGMSAKMSIYPK